MKFSTTIILTTLAALTVAIPNELTPSLASRKSKEPYSSKGKCDKNAQCKPKGLDIPVRCRNSECIEGKECIIAYSDTAPGPNDEMINPWLEAKCPTNLLPYEWDWPMAAAE